MGLADLAVRGGALAGRSTTHDPAFFGPATEARASEFGVVVVRMRLQREDGRPLKDTGQVFWHTSRLPESEFASVSFEVIGDGQWHDYRIRVAQNHRWRGVITRLRLDPCTQPGVKIEVAYVRLQR